MCKCPYVTFSIILQSIWLPIMFTVFTISEKWSNVNKLFPKSRQCDNWLPKCFILGCLFLSHLQVLTFYSFPLLNVKYNSSNNKAFTFHLLTTTKEHSLGLNDKQRRKQNICLTSLYSLRSCDLPLEGLKTVRW